MEQHIGMTFKGIICGRTSFGPLFYGTLFDHGNVNGLLHVTGRPNNYYHFDQVTHSLRSDERGKVFQLADRIRVVVSGVNLEERKIDFEPPDE